MFESALLEPGGRLTTHQRWTSLATMAAQAVGVAGMVLASMMFTDTLPRQFMPTIVLPVPPAGRAAETQRPPRPQSSLAAASRPGTFEAPRWIPAGVKRIVDAPQAPALNDDGVGVVGSRGAGGGENTILNEITRRAVPALPKPPAAGVVRLSRPEPGALIYRVEPR
jgi:anti-sigma factor RsiW